MALANDLNINEALGVLFTFIRTTNHAFDAGDAHSYATAYNVDLWQKFDAILGLGDATVSVPAEVQALVDQRAAAR